MDDQSDNLSGSAYRNFLAVLPISDGVVTIRAMSDEDAEAYAAGTGDALVRRFAHLPLEKYSPQIVRELIHSVIGVLSRNRRKFRQPINVACPAPGRWGRPNSRVTSRHFDHGNASRTSRPDCSGLDEAD